LGLLGGIPKACVIDFGKLNSNNGIYGKNRNVIPPNEVTFAL